MGLLGRSPRISLLRAQIQKLSEGRTPVLIQGESGTGKEVAAREIYETAPRGHFVPIDCGSLVGPLMESELFGHTRGAFTGAGEAKRGLLDLANGGTAFFDEIGDLALDLQVKLLRVLQEHEFRPVGSLQRVQVDIRVIAATHRDLQREVAAGRFREDLFHRLNVVRLTLPPLRERKEDIPLIVERFLVADGSRFTVSSEALDAMMAYDWPGNIRELKNCIERMIAFSSESLLRYEELPTNVINGMGAADYSNASPMAMAAGASGGSRSVAAGLQRISGFAGSDNIRTLYEVERQAIEQALKFTNGDRTSAAQLLGIGRTTLYRKLKEYAAATIPQADLPPAA